MSSRSITTRIGDEVATLTRLNDQYIEAVRISNIQLFDELLGNDFLCTLADGTLIGRDDFLAHASRPTTALGLEVHDVRVRILGDVAVVHAATSFSDPEGRACVGRYTDVWARRDSRWVAVAAQFMRRPAAARNAESGRSSNG